MSTPTCGTCCYFQRLRREKLAAHGFGLCAHRPVWETPSRHARCSLEPARWAPRRGKPAQAGDAT